MSEPKMPKILVCIDAGHGQDSKSAGVYDPGIVYAGIEEADLTLAYALTAKYVLSQHDDISVMLTRKSEEQPAPLSRRVARAIENDATHFISLHVNGADSFRAAGVESFFPALDRDNRHGAALARRLAAHASRLLGRPNRGAKPETESARKRLAVMAFPGPVALLEIGFLTNAFDRAKMTTREGRLAVAEAILLSVRGVEPEEIDT